MSAFLVPLDPGLCLIPLEKAIVLIGRQADCDVSLTHSRKVSRKHCCIAQVNDSYVVRDLGSTNGIFVNGTRVRKETGLALGDELAIGDVRFRLQVEATSKASKVQVEDPRPVRGAVSRPISVAPPSSDIPVASLKMMSCHWRQTASDRAIVNAVGCAIHCVRNAQHSIIGAVRHSVVNPTDDISEFKPRGLCW
jgi:pSer/pThr/pTyr-binding forkhead associated (FHA) protein